MIEVLSSEKKKKARKAESLPGQFLELVGVAGL
jgi:hypothetical protein